MVLIIELGVAILMIVALWKVFVKAGQPGWACIIPIYNLYILLKIASKPGWWLILLLIPLPVYVGLSCLSYGPDDRWLINNFISFIFLLFPVILLVDNVIVFRVCLGIAKNFGKGAWFAAGLFFLGFIFFPILAFGSAQYTTV